MVRTGGEDAPAVGREHRLRDLIRVTFKVGQQLAVGCVPHPRSVVFAGGDDSLAVGQNAARTTSAVWPTRVASSWPLTAFHTRAVLSKLAVTTRWPSGENAACQTRPV